MHYEEPVFRPPSEAYSLLLPVTAGCSNNRCTFCGMYLTKKYRLMDMDGIREDVEEARTGHRFKRAFLLDGDALAAPEPFLLEVLDLIRDRLPWIERVSVYGDAEAILAKGTEGMVRLREKGLGMVYHGIESGSAEVLERVKKPVTRDQMKDVGRIMRDCGVGYSVMALLGLGGTELTLVHGRETGEALTLLDPDYIGLLTLMLVPGTALANRASKGLFQLPDAMGMLRELRAILAGIEVTGARFSANHASNYLPVKGDLPEDKERLLAMVDQVLDTGDDSTLKPEWMRAL